MFDQRLSVFDEIPASGREKQCWLLCSEFLHWVGDRIEAPFPERSGKADRANFSGLYVNYMKIPGTWDTGFGCVAARPATSPVANALPTVTGRSAATRPSTVLGVDPKLPDNNRYA